MYRRFNLKLEAKNFKVFSVENTGLEVYGTSSDASATYKIELFLSGPDEGGQYKLLKKIQLEEIKGLVYFKENEKKTMLDFSKYNYERLLSFFEIAFDPIGTLCYSGIEMRLPALYSGRVIGKGKIKFL